MIRPQRNAFRDMIDLSGVWRALPDPDGTGEAAGWHNGLTGQSHPIAVPGSWNEQLAEIGLMNYIGDMWMQTQVFVPEGFAAGRDLSLRFGSADYQATVWVNEAKVGVSGAQHLPFELDVTGVVIPREKALIVVRVCAKLPFEGPTQRVTGDDYITEGRPKDEYLPTVRFDFFPYDGLNRPVYLVAASPSRIRHWRVETQLGQGLAKVQFLIQATPGVARIKVHIGDDCSVAGASTPVVDGYAAMSLTIKDASLWSPASPHLYPVTITALGPDEVACDQIDARIGLREIKVEGQSLLLNGAPITLKGFGKHEDSPMHGRGLNLPQMVKDFHLLDWCGANSVRTSHYPYADEFYDFCDERGIMVIDEVFSINLDFRKVTSIGVEAHKAAIAQMIARDAHHPCVIAWSLSNEPGYLGEKIYAQASAPYWAELFAFARSLDATRPLAHANVSYAGLDDPAFEQSDFLMINRYYGWYQAPADLVRAIAMLNDDFDTLAKAHGKPIFVAEFGADALAGQHATYPQLFTEDFQSDFVAAYWHAIATHPSVIGGHAWNFADFRTAQHGRRVVFNLKGVFTRDRTPKKAAFTLKDLWT